MCKVPSLIKEIVQKNKQNYTFRPVSPIQQTVQLYKCIRDDDNDREQERDVVIHITIRAIIQTLV